MPAANELGRKPMDMEMARRNGVVDQSLESEVRAAIIIIWSYFHLSVLSIKVPFLLGFLISGIKISSENPLQPPSRRKKYGLKIFIALVDQKL